MLQTPDTFDPSTRLVMALRGQIALDLETGAHVWASRGRSRGAPHYGLTIPIPAAQRTADPWGYVAKEKHHRFRAWSDAEALAHAQAYLTKWHATHPAIPAGT